LTASHVVTAADLFSNEKLDLLQMFGPVASMHAALETLDVGMPCGVVARFRDRTVIEIENAIEAACRHFPILERRIEWENGRPVLVRTDLTFRQARSTEISLGFQSNRSGPLWRYCLIADAGDVWLCAIWAHAAADGTSMLRLLETIGSTLGGKAALLCSPSRGPDRPRRIGMVRWVPRFLAEQYLPYVRPLNTGSAHPGVSWLTIPIACSNSLLENARSECGSIAAWLAGAVCLAFCEQHGTRAGRVLVNLPILRDDLQRLGGFGCGVGTMLIPVKIKPNWTLASVARCIEGRLKTMIAQGWDINFDRFLGNNPRRHLRFATACARGRATPVVSISWKGMAWQLGGEEGIHDVACFAMSPLAHVSAHLDQNGLSLSVASSHPAVQRDKLLLRIAQWLGDTATRDVRTFDGRVLATAGSDRRRRELVANITEAI
jgi:hypothetical protein